MLKLLWLVPLLPAAGFLVNGLLGSRVLPRRAVGFVGCTAVLLSFVLSAGAVWQSGGQRVTRTLFTWMPMAHGADGSVVSIDWAYALDPLASVMLLVVTGVGFLIHVYSMGYMAHEPQAAYARFFAYLNLFMAMMLTLVLGASLPVVFVGWEGVGLCSYLLIGFYHDRMFDERTGMSCADAGRKAFLTNRVGDVGFILGMLLLFSAAGTLDIQGILGKAGTLGTGVCTAAALLLFVGACGKSAQIPLYVWLPDAMAGPTPVSALIHAATMVTAGVYVTCRMAPLYLAAPWAMTVVAVVGALTALFAAVIGLAQDDIKKVLAYSTVSQLGYMMLAAGVGAFGAGIFHLMTHAFFKALLFLGAGSVIHALSGEQDVRLMGGLRRHLPWTHATFLVAVLAIAGVPPFSGFFSKDEILWASLAMPGGSLLLWGVGVLTAGLTAFYMTRLYMLIFAGPSRVTEEARHHLHEAPPTMLAPLLLLAAGALVAGFAGVPHFLGGGRIPNYLERYLAPVFGETGTAPASGTALGAGAIHGGAGAHAAGAPLTEWGAMAAALLASVAGIVIAAWLYRRGPLPQPVRSSLVATVKGKFYVDEFIALVVLRPYRAICGISAGFDEKVVDGLVNAAGVSADLAGQFLRLVQTGYVRSYALVFLLGTVVVMYYVLR